MDQHRQTSPKQVPRVEVYWHAVSYKTVALFLILAAGLIFVAVYFVFPSAYAYVVKKVSEAGKPDPTIVDPSQSKNKFVNLDGKVQVKKVSSVQWVNADFHTTLDKGDLIQTGSDGLARITFADSTSYIVKPDTLVTVEENNVTHDQTTSAVHINVGQVDLSTASSPNSVAAVSAETFKAQVRPNSQASVTSDPNAREGQITVTGGSAEVQRGQEQIEVGANQRANIPATGPITKSEVLRPPELSEPRNLAPIVAENPKTAGIHFEWKPVPDAISYNLRISTTTMFTKLIRDVKVSTTSADITGLDAGDYFWSVIATDTKKQTSQQSEPFKFSLFAQGKAQEMALEITGWQIHGRLAEITGRTEPGAAIIINGQAVANIASDGKFSYFTEPLDPGEHTIVIIGQNRRGGTAKKEISIVVPK